MKHFSHKHPLSLIEVKVQWQKKKYEGRNLIRYGCHKSISFEDFAYFCTQYECEVPIALSERDMEMKHFSHKHPLSLIEVKVQQQKKKYEGRDLICYGCLESISSEDFAYFCTQYECEGIFFLHQSCAELPQEISHPNHPEHSLILSPRPIRLGGSWCCMCRGSWEGFTYNCSLCNFTVHGECLLKDDPALLSIRANRNLNHKSHEHPLIFKPRPALFFCNACGTEDKDQSYSCSMESCPFWIHKSCALLPDIKESNLHNHPLSLAYSFPLEYQHHPDLMNCDICRKDIYLGYWVYYCRLCRDFFHVKCVDANTNKEIDEAGMTPNLGLNTEDISEEYHENCSVKLPGSDILAVSHIFVELTRDFLKKYDHAQELLTEIKHFSHEHPLILSNGHEHDVKEMKYEEAVICDGCILPICDSYYTCENCNYVLHASCAQLPEEFQHSSHPDHPLVLRKLQGSFSFFECSLCKLRCNGFLYEGSEGYPCLDLKCAILDTVSVIKHEAHPHQLVQYKDSGRATCKSCRRDFYGPSFLCEKYRCGFCLDYGCILLPRYISHFDSFRVYKRDDHRLTLMHPPYIEHEDDFYCEICEEEIHPKYSWLYHCLECDRSFHSYCIVELEKYRNMKFGATLQVLNHRHALKFIIRTGFTPFCEWCDGDLYYEMVFGCRDCDYYLCYLCGIHSQDFDSSIFKSSVHNMEIIVAENSNSVFEDNSINLLPASDISLELMVRHFLKSYGIIESQLSAEIKDFSHRHPLNLYFNEPKDVKELKNEEILVCDGCVRPISDPYYGCKECNYFLHAYCAQLGQWPDEIEIQLPNYSGHGLVIGKPYAFMYCDICHSRCNGLVIMCGGKYCGVLLDIHCAVLTASSNFAKHEAHSCHQLVLTDVRGEFWCNACGHALTGNKAFSCDDCGFHLHGRCALLPRFARHVMDEHTLTLCYRSFRQHPKVLYCGSCKKKMNPILWFYHCSECNQSFHPQCIPELDREFQKMKFGGILKVLTHPHAIKLVRKDKFSCDTCTDPKPLDLAYECESCGYYICMNCAEKLLRNKTVEEAPQETDIVGSSST